MRHCGRLPTRTVAPIFKAGACRYFKTSEVYEITLPSHTPFWNHFSKPQCPKLRLK
ncbi:hypothetical protein JAAARDRAFT_616173 [Jaapia argillacea MUCL 33604]|uniref:Uncharacterized protein n=1 Tax=Jaapia argillacea MUCL 33604 TaxID=933084 RepID=A0A067PF71_9AGAM|nr:hypothetical protein JAAARDRAFT_616173 [Jaapia argillacea MUCL 33604]